MPEIIFVQSQISQLDEAVYSHLNDISDEYFHVIYWNDYGLEKTIFDDELGITPSLSDTFDLNYPRTWIDNRNFSILKVYSTILALKPRLVVMADIPSHARVLLALGLRPRRIAVALRTDKNRLSETARTGAGLTIERTLTKSIFNILAPVSPLTLEYYGWPKRRRFIFFPYTTNERKFCPPSGLRERERRNIRETLGIEKNDHVFLSAAKFVDRENPWDIIKSFEIVKKEHNNISLIALGDGPLLSEIKEYCALRGITDIHFPGFIPFAKLQRYFFAADTFLHFAQVEPWGVSVQDALLAGLGLVASTKVGSAQVFAQGSLQQFIVPPGHIEQYAQKMTELCELGDACEKFKSARNAAQDYTASNVAQIWAQQSI